jgi:hypothetical protein
VPGTQRIQQPSTVAGRDGSYKADRSARGALVEGIELAVDHRNGVATAIEHKNPSGVRAPDRVVRADAQRNMRGDGVSSSLDTIGDASVRYGVGRDGASHAAINSSAYSSCGAASREGIRRQIRKPLCDGIGTGGAGDADHCDRACIEGHIQLESVGRAGQNIHLVEIRVQRIQSERAAKERDHRIDATWIGRCAGRGNLVQGAIGDLFLLKLRGDGDIGNSSVFVERPGLRAATAQGKGFRTGTDGGCRRHGVAGVIDDGAEALSRW